MALEKIHCGEQRGDRDDGNYEFGKGGVGLGLESMICLRWAKSNYQEVAKERSSKRRGADHGAALYFSPHQVP